MHDQVRLMFVREGLAGEYLADTLARGLDIRTLMRMRGHDVALLPYGPSPGTDNEAKRIRLLRLAHCGNAMLELAQDEVGEVMDEEPNLELLEVIEG